MNLEFKQTEIGVIPEDWKLKSYDELFDFLSTATYSRAELTENDEVQYVHYGDIHTKWNHLLDLNKTTLPTIKPSQVKSYSHIKDGDIIMADASEDYEGVGKSVEVVNVNNKKVISGLHTFLLRDTNNQIASGFKAYLHKNKLIKTQFDRLATGMKVYGVSRNNLKTVLIPLPPTKQEQTAIATALSDTDALIENLKKLIDKKRNIKIGVMQKLFTPKEKWHYKSIEELCLPDGLVRGPFGGALKKEFFVETGFKVYEQKNVIYRDISLGNYYINDLKLKELKRFEVREKDFIVSCSGTIGKIFQIPKDFETGIINQALLKITIDTTKYCDNYFYHYFSWDKFQAKIIDSTQGGAMKNLIGMSDFRKTLLPLPPTKDEQVEISNILTDIDNEIESLEQKLNKYRMIKQGMMQVLLTGKIRLV